MNAKASTLDDLLHDVFSELLVLPFDVKSTRSEKDGASSEIFGALLHLTNPRARLSRTETKGTIFSAIGELLWYLSGSDKLDFIKYYIKDYVSESDDGKVLYGAYGPRLLKAQSEHNQIDNVISLLRENRASRRAVIQLFEARDIAGKKKKEIPCTCSLQFVIRKEKFHLMANMRSNDAFKGLPHDIFAFSMMQEILARTLGVELGEYYHSVGSLHLYETAAASAREYIEEGIQPTKRFMPPMPEGDPWPAITQLLAVEEKIRTGQAYTISELDPYWQDLARLLEVYAYHKKKEPERIQSIQESMSTKLYDTYIAKKIATT
jgi:thymidylate synthase